MTEWTGPRRYGLDDTDTDTEDEADPRPPRGGAGRGPGGRGGGPASGSGGATPAPPAAGHYGSGAKYGLDLDGNHSDEVRA